MKPGRELDALVAEKVMGFIRVRDTTVDVDGVRHGGDVLLPPSTGGEWDSVIADYSPKRGPIPLDYWVRQRYSTDIAAAWEVLEKVEADDFWCKLTRKTYSIHSAHETDPMWECYLRCVRGGTRKGPVAAAETAPHAICLAALRAVGVEVDDG